MDAAPVRIENLMGKTAAPPNNLPAALTSLIGRDKESAALRQLMQRAEVRLVTLTGPGGVGKTRLALQGAGDLLWDFADGVYFVDLTFLARPDQVLPAIGQTLGLREEGTHSLAAVLLDHLRDRQMLLLLDNFEQVIDAGAAVRQLLEHCPQVKVLVTSREALRLRGEHELDVPPLALPARAQAADLAAVAQSAAVALFVKRAGDIKHDFALTTANAADVAGICARLDGLPLALELAATLIKTLTPSAMLARLNHRLPLLVGGPRDLPSRHQTLRATIEWSYSLLSAEEQALFRCIAAFAGGGTIEMIAAVATPDGPMPDPEGINDNADILAGLGALINKSLLRQVAPNGEPRYLMLETIREYGLEQLAARQERDAVRGRHTAAYLAWAERIEPDLAGPQQGALMDGLEQEHDNLRAALTWATTTGQVAVALRLTIALWWFWRVRGYVTEGRRWLQAALDLPFTSDADTQLLRARALNAAGVLAYEQGDYAPAIQHHEASLALVRALGRKGGIASSLNNLGLVARGQGDYATARRFYEESLALRREIEAEAGTAETRWNIAVNLNNLGVIAYEMGDYADARRLHDEGLALRRALGDKRGTAMSLNNLGNVLARLGQYDAARALQEESLGLQQEVGAKWGIAAALISLGHIALACQDLAGALQDFTAGFHLRDQLGDKEGIAECLEGIAAVAWAGGQAEQAARLLGAGDALREETQAPMPPLDREEYETLRTAVQRHLGPRGFGAAWHTGRGLLPQQALAAEAIVILPDADPLPSDAPVLAAPVPRPPVQAAPAAAAPLDQAAFTAAALEALRDLGRATALESNALLRSQMVAQRAGQAAGTTKRVAALQSLVREACATLTERPKDAKLYGAVYHTYLHPAASQEQAAEQLDLPFSTFRRHLRDGRQRVVEVLWQWERAAHER